MKGIPTNEIFKKNDESTEVADVNPNGENIFPLSLFTNIEKLCIINW